MEHIFVLEKPQLSIFILISMACPQVVDRAESLPIWWVAASILNKQLWTNDKGWSSSLLHEGLRTPHHKETACYKILHQASELDRFFGT
jgi:hypothetical protein